MSSLKMRFSISLIQKKTSDEFFCLYTDTHTHTENKEMKVSKVDSLSFFLNNPILLAFLISLETFLKNSLRNITDL